MTVNLVLVGFGNVGRRFARLLKERETRLRDHVGLETRIVGIATRRHGCLFNEEGLDAIAAAEHVESGAGLGLAADDQPDDVFSLVDRARARLDGHVVLVETTTLDVDTGQPALDHVRAALRAGFHVITANKGPIACAYAELAEEAARAGRSFLFEGTVLDGVPVFNFVRETLPGVSVIGFRAILNTTTHHILVAMERGEPFDAALARMQQAGIAEADPSLDVEGWDAAAKTAALLNVLMGARLSPAQIEREGIAGLPLARVEAASASGRRLRLVARGWIDPGGPRGRVALEPLEPSDPLAHLGPLDNAIVFETDLLGEIAVEERNGGLVHTAYALVTDLVTAARRLGARPSGPPRHTLSPGGRGSQ